MTDKLNVFDIHVRHHFDFKSLTNFITYRCIEYTSPWAEFELTASVVIGSDYTGNCKSKYNVPYDHNVDQGGFLLNG